MCKVLIFGGTTEGRILAEYCSENRIPAYVSVVSEYGRELLKEDLYVRPLTGPMDAGQMRAFIADEAIELVVDATHPYARNATENIKSACRDTKTAYLRYLRNTEDERENAGDELFSTPEEAAKWLEETKGNIFVTTGSNELAAFAGTEKLKHRIFARVLPSSFAVGKCEELGITGKHLICMQGPFTKEMNAAMLRQTNAAYLVTKETGKAGGFDEKLEAARECGVLVIIIGHPKETGSGMNQIYSQLSRFSVRGTPFERREVLLAGIGPGSEALMTQEVREAIRNSDFLIGAPRMLKAAAACIKREQTEGELPAVKTAYLDFEVEEALRLHHDWQRAVILYSGDSGFHSGTRKLAERLKKNGCSFRVLPGISSVSYFAARLGISWDDALLASAHGCEFDAASALKSGCRKIFLLTGGKNGAGELCRRLTESGFGHVKVTVGEKLSYRDEQITEGSAKSLCGREFEPLSLVLIEEEKSEK